MKLFNYKNIQKDNFFSSKPFPNIELKDLWNEDLLEKCFEEVKALYQLNSENLDYNLRVFD
jgi:hypothetical protein